MLVLPLPADALDENNKPIPEKMQKYKSGKAYLVVGPLAHELRDPQNRGASVRPSTRIGSCHETPHRPPLSRHPPCPRPCAASLSRPKCRTRTPRCAHDRPYLSSPHLGSRFTLSDNIHDLMLTLNAERCPNGRPAGHSLAASIPATVSIPPVAVSMLHDCSASLVSLPYSFLFIRVRIGLYGIGCILTVPLLARPAAVGLLYRCLLARGIPYHLDLTHIVPHPHMYVHTYERLLLVCPPKRIIDAIVECMLIVRCFDPLVLLRR